MPVTVIVALISLLAGWFVARSTTKMQGRRLIVERRLQHLQGLYKPLLLTMQEIIDLVRASVRDPASNLRPERLLPFAQTLEQARIDFVLSPHTLHTDAEYLRYLLAFRKLALDVQDLGSAISIERRREHLAAMEKAFDSTSGRMRLDTAELEDQLYRAGFFELLESVPSTRRSWKRIREAEAELDRLNKELTKVRVVLGSVTIRAGARIVADGQAAPALSSSNVPDGVDVLESPTDSTPASDA